MNTMYLLRTCLFLAACIFSNYSFAQESVKSFSSKEFEFQSNGLVLNGLFDTPINKKPKATIIYVHGYGKTNIVEWKSFYDLRQRFAKLGISGFVWDKPGCGKSEGVFDINQAVESSGQEVIDAVKALRKSGLPGKEQIGLIGFSRGGWIAPIALSKEPSLDFWISVSGPDDQENFRYLLESNFPIEGRTTEQTKKLVNEWQNQFNLVWQGGTYEQALAAAPTLYEDPMMKELGFSQFSKESFQSYQNKFKSGKFKVNKKTQLMIYVDNFPTMLRNINIPVLAIFGEKDTNIDWRKTRKLYLDTIGENPKASLIIKTFPNANHSLKPSQHGGYRELMQQWQGPNPVGPVKGYYEEMERWLIEQGLGLQ